MLQHCIIQFLLYYLPSGCLQEVNNKFKESLFLKKIHAFQETQALGIHDILNAEGFNTVSHLEVHRCERILYSKAKG